MLYHHTCPKYNLCPSVFCPLDLLLLNILFIVSVTLFPTIAVTLLRYILVNFPLETPLVTLLRYILENFPLETPLVTLLPYSLLILPHPQHSIPSSLLSM